MTDDRVALVGYDYLEVVSRTPAFATTLRSCGGRRGLFRRHIWTFRFAGEKELAVLMVRLREAGLPFAAHPKGCPADVFEALRKKELVTGPFTIWTHDASGAPLVKER